MYLGMAALLCGLAFTPAEAQERQGRTPQTDQTVPVARGARLAIDNFAGEVSIRAWDKDALQVRARHSSRIRVNIRTAGSVVTLSAGGANGSVDYDIMAPAWMPIKIDGQYDYVTVEGTASDVSVETVRGDVSIKGGAGTITAKTIEGEILVDGARGKLNLSTVNQGIKVSASSGDVTAETTNGSIALSRMDASSVDAATVNGNVTYEGSIADRGRYVFSTHNGDIVMTVPETANATFNVRTYNGEFGSSLPLKGPERTEFRRGKRMTYTLGSGSAEVEMESFGGAIRLRRTGTARTGRE